MDRYWDSPRTNELRAALGAYEEARQAWKGVCEAIAREAERRGEGSVSVPSNEGELFTMARTQLDADYLEDVPRSVVTEALFTPAARLYLLAFDNLSVALEGVREQLEKISGQEASEPTDSPRGARKAPLPGAEVVELMPLEEEDRP